MEDVRLQIIHPGTWRGNTYRPRLIVGTTGTTALRVTEDRASRDRPNVEILGEDGQVLATGRGLSAAAHTLAGVLGRAVTMHGPDGAVRWTAQPTGLPS